MAITDAKKVDYLWKKIGYGATKTDTNANKAAPNEAIASPLLLRGDKTWNQASSIPATIPGSSSGVVTVYPTSAPDETTNDATASTNRSWKTGLTDWIPPEFGATYGVKIYIHTTGDAGNAASSGTRVFAGGSGNNDEYFFDYQSGVVHFIGTNLPNGVNFSGKTVYVSGARYSGTLGLQNNVANTGDITFTGSTLSAPSNADMTFDNSGTGQYIFEGTTSLTVPKGTTAQRPSAEEGVIRFNTTTGKYEVSEDGSTYTALRTEAVAGTISKDIFTGDGSTTSFTMSTEPSDLKNVIVYIDGVMQEPTQNYTMSGTTITTAGEAAHSGARIVVMHGFAD
tara:strand:- start:518 stop:1534 length:1017 start_codon:yes stop_codon:yes gene_type:complete